MPLVDRNKCADKIESGQLEFYCTKKRGHKGKHGTRWVAHNYTNDFRMICVSWSAASVGGNE